MRTIAIVGSGQAGLLAAHALVQRDWILSLAGKLPTKVCAGLAALLTRQERRATIGCHLLKEAP